MTSLTNKNIVANVFGRLWSVFSVFIFIPIYINILGVKMYGIVSFYAILQGLLIFADAGLTATLRRELAKGDSPDKDVNFKYKIFRSIEFVYFLIVSIIFLSIFFASDFIVTGWLNIEDLSVEQVKRSIQIMGFALSLNFLSSLYQGGILGLEKQVASNFLQIVWGLLKNGGVILVILLISKTLTAFFLWQAGINLLYVFVLRYYVVNNLKNRSELFWNLRKDITNLKHIWKYATGMLVISIIAALNSQFDKLILSNYLEVSNLAIYTLAYSLAMVPVVLAGPVSIAVFPRFVKYFDLKSQEKLTSIFNNSFKFVLLLTSTAGIILAMYSELFLTIWTLDPEISSKAALSASILLVGQMFLSFQVIPFNLALAKGNTKINITIGLSGLILLIPLVIILAKKYGMVGAASSWLIVSGLITPVFIITIIKKLTDFDLKKWIFNQILKPITLVLIGNILFYYSKPSVVSNQYFILLYVTCTSIIVFIIAFRITFKVRYKNFKKFIKNELFA